MDWYTWLSRSGLDPSLVYDYSLVFTHNELEDEDIAYFNHEFLLSMGISIAKHRLEILKLAKKLQKKPNQPVAKLLSAVTKAKKCLSKYIQGLSAGRNSSAIVVVPKQAARSDESGGGWVGAVLRRNKRLVLLKQGRLVITDGVFRVRKADASSVSQSPSPSPMVYKCGGGGDGDGFSGSGEEEMRWDSMFQDLKPT